MEQVKPELVSPADVAKALSTSTQALAMMRYQGTGPKFIKLTTGARGAVRYRWSDVQAWLDQNTRQCTRPGVA